MANVVYGDESFTELTAPTGNEEILVDDGVDTKKVKLSVAVLAVVGDILTILQSI